MYELTPPALCLSAETKSNGLVHCSVKNAAVLYENNRERVTQIYRLYDKISDTSIAYMASTEANK